MTRALSALCGALNVGRRRAMKRGQVVYTSTMDCAYRANNECVGADETMPYVGSHVHAPRPTHPSGAGPQVAECAS